MPSFPNRFYLLVSIADYVYRYLGKCLYQSPQPIPKKLSKTSFVDERSLRHTLKE